MPLSKMSNQTKAKSLINDIRSKTVSNEIACDNNTDKNETFEASQDWFERFNLQANLQSIAIKGEAAKAEISSVECYPTVKFLKVYFVKNETFGASQGWFERLHFQANLQSIALKGEAAKAEISSVECYATVKFIKVYFVNILFKN